MGSTRRIDASSNPMTPIWAKTSPNHLGVNHMTPLKDELSVDGDIVCSGDIKGPTIEEIHKKIEEGQMSVDELEAAVHYIVNMELKSIVLDVDAAFAYAGSQISAYTPSRVTEPEHILLEMDLMSNMIGNTFVQAGASIRTSFNNRLEKHGYNS